MNKERLIKEAEAFADHVAHRAYDWGRAAESGVGNVDDHCWATMNSIVSMLDNLWFEICDGEEAPAVLEEARSKAKWPRKREVLDEILDSF